MSSPTTLTDRQLREAQFYRHYVTRQRVDSIDFSPVESPSRRPWNPYWHVYGLVRDRYLSPNQRVLDFGCGIGIAALRFAHLGYQVDGFDLSSENITVARGLADKYHLAGKCTFTEMLAEKLDYPSATFDIVVGIDILHHVEIEQSIRQITRVLRPGGVAIFKEHVEVPVLDPIRNTAALRAIASRRPSLDRHITPDERKLTARDLDLIQRSFGRVEELRFTLISRLDRVLPGCDDRTRGRLQRLDQRLLQACPAFAQLGGTVVLTCYKEDHL